MDAIGSVTKPIATMSPTTRWRLNLQGFACDSDPRVAASTRSLRFTPALSTLCIVAGTVLRSPAILFGYAVIAGGGAAGWHSFDALFNGWIRRWVQAERLPANPAPRRFAMAVAAIWSAGTAWLMATGQVWVGVAAGSVLAVAGLTVATTHFCLGSWLYRILGR